jgi:hypothetical protein
MGYKNRPKSEIELFESLPEHLAINDEEVWVGDDEGLEDIREEVAACWNCFPEQE